MSLRLGCLLAAACAVNSIALAQPAQFSDPQRRAKLAAAFPEIDRLVTEFIERSHVPGAAWGVIVDGELAHTGTTGLREITSRAAVDADTVFRIASMTKSFTAMAILKLRDEGRLSLDDAAERYVPELKAIAYPTSDSPRITIRHLLSHSSGLDIDTTYFWLVKHHPEYWPEAGEPPPYVPRALVSAPGTAYSYANVGYTLLTMIASKGACSGNPSAASAVTTLTWPYPVSLSSLLARSVTWGSMSTVVTSPEGPTSSAIRAAL